MTRFQKVVGILLLSISLACLVPLARADSNTAGQTQAQTFQRTIQDVRMQINGWQRSANIQTALVIIIGISGVLVSALHQVDKKWAKITVLVLGIVTSIATVVSGSNAVFSADYRSLRGAVSEANRVVERMDEIEGETASLSAPSDIATAKEQMNDQLNAFDKVAEKVESSGQAGSSSSTTQSHVGWPFEIPVVHAQNSFSAAPSWIKSLPSDKLNLYFVGTGTDVSLANAKENSLADAKSQIAQSFEFGQPYVSSDARKTLISTSSTVQDTYFASSGNSQFTFYTLVRISRDLQRMQPAPAQYDEQGWHPLDLTLDPNAGLFALDRDGKVLRITQDQNGIHLQQLFQLPAAFRPAAIAANQDSVYVSSNSETGCNVFQYSFGSGQRSQRNVGGRPTGCDGIATYGAGLFLAFPGSQEIRYWSAWSDKTTQSFSAPESFPNCVIHFDTYGRRLLFAGPTGNAFALALDTRQWSKLTSNLGYVNSIAVTPSSLLFASGGKVLFIARNNKNSGLNPPAGMESLGAGLISGVAVDSSNAAWITDYDKSSVRGPFSLN